MDKNESKKLKAKTIEFLDFLKTAKWSDLVQIFQIAEKKGFHITKADFYSPIPIVNQLTSEDFLEKKDLHINWNVKNQMDLLEELSSFSPDFQKFLDIEKYTLQNESFGYHDAPTYFCLIRHFKPKKIIEIGAGNSTKIAYYGSLPIGTLITTIDPFVSDNLGKQFSERVEVIKEPVQEIPISVFESLSENDILFIDSTHVSKINSDVNYLFLEVLPIIRPGVIVHIHDIFLPGSYPRKWLEWNLLFWNEQYLLNAFLIGNDDYEIILTNYYMRLNHPNLLKKFFETGLPPGGGSFWMRRKSNGKS